MKRVLTRLATTLLAAPLALTTLAAPAQASTGVTLPGCYGAGSAVYCDVTVTIPVPVEVYETSVPVCAGTCTDVPVTLARLDRDEEIVICATWTNRAGYPSGVCTTSLDPQPIDPISLTQLREALASTYDDIVYAVCRGTSTLRCSTALEQVLYTVSQVIRG